MKKNHRIPTLVALFLLIGGVAGGVILIKSGSTWLAGARPEITPKQVKITNVSESGFTVSWITDEQTSGFIQYGAEGELSFIASDDRDQLSGQQGKFWIHHVTLKDLKPATNYFFKINSGEKIFDNNGQPYQIKTAPTIQETMPPNDVAYGTILKQDGSPAEGVIVYLSLANAAPLSGLTRASGNWAIPLNLARLPDLSSWATYDKEASVEEIFVQGGSIGTATAVTVTKYDSPVPNITLGQSFDFRKESSQPTPTAVPTSASSGFSVSKQESSSSSANLTIINPSEGEEVNTSRPEILGTGPSGETLTITVNSPETLTSQITINGDGTWNWIPPTSLSPGKHTITARLADGRIISRSFTVLAAGSSDMPSFTASPSATITLTPTPTATPALTPTSTASGRISIPSTEGGIPKPGYLTPTFLVFMIGVVLVFLGLLTNILF